MRNKKVKGFTLIELIVVIAIIAVLAAILIPNLMGWVGKSSLRTANTNARAVATNGTAVLADLEVEGIYLSGGFTGEA
ncbi:MAG TPA: prepilin-type N-terminal cleavage/methylation domain-containing protein, partial [Clostridiales bacterium]|nr:prepilin-type N-terminal cleavage/methylation domain-containing protein [Clostridiales bacterium]